MGKYNVGEYWFFKVAEQSSIKFYTCKVVTVDDIDLRVLTIKGEESVIKIIRIIAANKLTGNDLKKAISQIQRFDSEVV